MSSPPGSPTLQTRASATTRLSASNGAPPSLQRSSTMVGLQSKSSFISTLRTLPTQRQSIVAAEPISIRGESSIITPQSSSVLEEQASLRRMGTQSPLGPKSATMNGGEGFPRQISSNPDEQQASHGGDSPNHKHHPASTTTSHPTPSYLGSPNRQESEPRGEFPRVPTKAPLPDHRHDDREICFATWKEFFLLRAKLPPTAAEDYNRSFEENDIPLPTEIDILQHGVDHETLIALGVHNIGHRTRIVAACRSLAAALSRKCCSTSCAGPSKGPHTSGRVGGPTPEHYDKSHAPMFPKIYRPEYEDRAMFRGDGDSEGSGIDDVGLQVQSLEASFSSEQVSLSRRHSNRTRSNQLSEPLIHRHEQRVGAKGSINNANRSARTLSSSSSSSSDTSTSSSSSSSAVTSNHSHLHGEVITDETHVHEFVRASEGPHGYTWVDVVGRDPKRLAFRDHMKQLVKTYHFAEPLLLDIDLTLALPQMISCPNEPEQFLIILRVAAESSGGIEEDSLHLLTNRVMIAVHLGTNTIVSIHRRDSLFMATLRQTWKHSYADKPMSVLLCRILDDGLLSYVDAIHDSESLLDEYEALMLKHSVGGGGGSSHSSPAKVPRGNASFSSDDDEPWWSAKSICERFFGDAGGDTNSTRGRSHTVINATAASQLRLRNKAYRADMLDSGTFSRQRMNQLLYHLHRRCSVYNRMLTLTQTTLEVSYTTLQLASADYAEQVGRSCGELAMKAETLHDNCQNLLNLHLSLVSFRTNELMNLLTVYSAIFIPITFVCSVYGMNFINMPELELYYGYYYCLALMGLMVLGILIWFRRKGFI